MVACAQYSQEVEAEIILPGVQNQPGYVMSTRSVHGYVARPCLKKEEKKGWTQVRHLIETIAAQLVPGALNCFFCLSHANYLNCKCS